MKDSGSVRLQWSSDGVDWPDLLRLFKAAELRGREGDKVRRAFERSDLVCFAKIDARLVGAARALTDGEYHATIYDVVVDPEFQSKGIGTRLMTELLARLPVWRVFLVADQAVQPFYERLGFRPYGDVMARLNRENLFDPA